MIYRVYATISNKRILISVDTDEATAIRFAKTIMRQTKTKCEIEARYT